MATWGQIERELHQSAPPGGPPQFDAVRRKYLKELADYTGRSTIVYETNGFSPPSGSTPSDLSISLDPDVGAFMEVVHGLPKDVPIDLILHSPGGTAEAAEAIVDYLRGRFPGLRVIVPVAAMSAATMMAMAADEIVMAAHSQLGPIDPQLTINTPEGPRTAPTSAIRRQFAEAQADLAQHPEHMAAWLPIIRSMSPALLQICGDAESLSKSMVENWLTKYMFSGDPTTAAAKAKSVADELSDYESFGSHGRRVDRDRLRAMGLTAVTDLEDDQHLQDLVLSVHHAINHTMNMVGLLKIVENHEGKAFIRRNQGMVFQVPMAPGAPQVPTRLGVPAPAPPANRQQQREQERKQRKKGR